MNVAYRWPHIFALCLPLLGGLTFFGWRCAVVVAVVMAAGMGAGTLLRRVGKRGSHMQLIDVAWALLGTCLLLPAALATFGGTPWMLGVGVLVALSVWGFGGPATSQVPIPAVVILLLGIVQPSRLEQPAVLDRTQAVTGDVSDFQEGSIPERPWYRLRGPAHGYRSPADSLQRHTAGTDDPDVLLRAGVPPLADLVLGATPTTMGNSALLTLLALMLLAKTNRFDPALPMLAAMSAYVTLLALPHAGNGWQFFGGIRDSWLEGLTFVHYEILSGPMLPTMVLLAAMPGVRPLTLPGRILFAAVLGLLAAVLQVFVSVALGPLVALCGVALLTPVLDRQALPRPLL